MKKVKVIPKRETEGGRGKGEKQRKGGRGGGWEGDERERGGREGGGERGIERVSCIRKIETVA